MNRINRLFEQKNRDILSIYYPAGYPAIDDTMPILESLQAQGVDMVELGIPFSDPMADGVVIEQAAQMALKNGMTLKRLFTQIEHMRESITIPVILMGYLNPIMKFGFEEFCRQCARVGVDGVIIPDLPFAEYISHYKHIAQRYNIKVVMLITPETSDERIRLIDEHTNSFIYMVSTAATTGMQSGFGEQTISYFERVDAMGLISPRLVGFGISTPQSFNAACKHSSGAIVGSLFVKLLASEQTTQLAVERLIGILTK